MNLGLLTLEGPGAPFYWTRNIHYLQRSDSGSYCGGPLFLPSSAHTRKLYDQGWNLYKPPSNPQANNLTLFMESTSQAIDDESRVCLRPDVESRIRTVSYALARKQSKCP
jgi:hypothetical protein